MEKHRLHTIFKHNYLNIKLETASQVEVIV